MALLVSKREAARLLGVDRNWTLDRLVKEGAIRVVQVGKRVRIPMAEVERLAREGEPTPIPPPRRTRRPVQRRDAAPPPFDLAAERAKLREALGRGGRPRASRTC